MNSIENTAEQVLRFINQTNKSIFLTGKAGTGKTTLLHHIIQTSHKNTVVVAPTGIAALNAGGVTIHSQFQLPFGGFIPENTSISNTSDHLKFETKNTLVKHFRMSGQKKAVIQNMELLIIDEVSMLRADLLDAIDFTLRKIRKRDTPFGGVQVLFIGDLLQLPPVVKNEEWHVLRNYYNGIFFFNAKVIHEQPPLYIELTKIYRQSDEQFISVLNNLRNNQITKQDVLMLNDYVKPDFDVKANKGYITLTTHNAKADALNTASLADLDGKSYTFKPEVVGDFPERIYPVDETLQLKVGAQVMFIKNDSSPEKNYFNGKMGFIKSLSEGEILVHFPDENKTIAVDKYEWKNIRYSVDEMTKEIQEEVLGSFVHYPLKLAWAITVHKSQGLTFDKAVLDVSQVFVSGQAYVALSRLRSLEGLILLSPIQLNGISNNSDVMTYSESKVDPETLSNSLVKETHNFVKDYLKNAFEWHDLAQEWRNHRFSYPTDSEKSERSKHLLWAIEKEEEISKLLEPANKFRAQLDFLFAAEQVDLKMISDRIEAAYNYFFPKLDTTFLELLLKIETVQRIKRVKEFYQELQELEDKHYQIILKLFKAVKLIKIINEGKEINKENLSSELIRNYRKNKIDEAQELFKSSKNEIIVEDEVLDKHYYLPKKKKSNEPKKSTVQETYELWIQNNSVNEIAKIRVLTTQTIYGHLAKLITAGTISISDVLPEDRIQQLATAFQDYQEDSLNALKEKFGDQFTWDELRLYKATLSNVTQK
ncbi:helix-turn-helix domain-containing protein [Flavobacterium sp. UBA6135]|uniref:helix-turn-helix domain-containing protein n=1 Tax=Flavobacterium sp. UBA6135 TaxID=1946553 RepID=UPI0025B8F9F6|nr:helix-turn-helix domain-containing protein [Flavobacterium sp. UBA6135]